MPAAIAIPLALGAKLQSDASRDAANAQVNAANKAAELQAQSAREALAFQQSQATQDQQNFTNTQLANYGQYAQRENNIGQLGQFLGLPARQAAPAPAYLTTQQTAPTSSTSMPGSDPASYTLSLIQGGMTPDKAAAETNQKFNLQTGSQAVYYPDNNTIGLPNAYLAGPTNRPDSPKGWGIVPRQGGGAAAPMASSRLSGSENTFGALLPAQMSIRTPALQMPGGY